MSSMKNTETNRPSPPRASKLPRVGRKPLAILSAGATLAFAATALAQVTLLDQMQPLFQPERTFNHVVGGSSNQRLAQTFTVGQTGKLTQIFLPISCTGGSLEVAVFDVQNDVPGAELTSKLFRSEDIPTFVDVGDAFRRFRMNGATLQVVEGEQLAIVLSIDEGSCGMVPSPAGDTYAEGVGFFEALPNAAGFIPMFGSGSPLDFAFITHVKPD